MVFSIDIRVFLLALLVTMSISFLSGVGLLGEYVNPLFDLGASWVKEAGFWTSAPTSNLGKDAYEVRDSYTLTLEEATKRVPPAHLPSGQHLLIDIEGVEAEFLNSEKRLTEAMVASAEAAGLVMVSSHCHSLVPMGVSCVGVLLESHISFHTWPEEGVITLDVFTSGSRSLLSVVKTIEKLFGPPRDDMKLRTQWSHEIRGYRTQEEKALNYLDDSSDLSLWILSPLEVYHKEQIFSNVTKYQRVDVWDLVELTSVPSYDDVIKHNLQPGDPRLGTPELATPDRMLFLDGAIQSISSTENIFHEALVHPGMFTHPNPKHVAILGGAEGATLREVLKHKNLESVTMIEIDEELVEITRKYLPKMSNCSNFVGRSDNCFDDEIVNLFFEDGHQWFVDRYGKTASIEPQTKAFDVILMDAPDPEDNVEVAEHLYDDGGFLKALVSSLSSDGILVVQIGTTATIDDARADKSIYKKRETLFNLLEANDQVEAMLVYEEANCGFLEPRAFLVACRSVKCRSRWYARSDQIDFEIYERIVTTKNNRNALSFYDGTTHRSYQYPKKGWETVYCRREPTPFECSYRHLNHDSEVHELNFKDPSKNTSFSWTIAEDENGKKTISSVFAVVDIPKGSYIMPEHSAGSLQLSKKSIEDLKLNTEVSGGRVPVVSDLVSYLDKYSHESKVAGSDIYSLEIGGTTLVGRTKDPTRANIGAWMPGHPGGARPKFSPVYERHRLSFDVFMIATRDIPAGGELLIYQE